MAAFEQSLSNMTSRLQQLTATAERKDDELTDMRQTIELLRKQSIQAGLTTAHMQSMGVQTQAGQQAAHDQANAQQTPPLPARGAQMMQNRPLPTPLNGQSNSKLPAVSNASINSIQRQHSSESMCSINSMSSGCSAQDKKKKKGWLRSSFTKAFSRNAKISKTSRHAESVKPADMSANRQHRNAEQQSQDVAAAGSVMPMVATAVSSVKSSPAKTVTLIENAQPIDAIETDEHKMVEELKKQLREKDLVLTDIRLEALSSASQLENLKETVNKMRAEMMSLKQNNERLQKLVTTRSLASSEVSLGGNNTVAGSAGSPSGSLSGDNRRFSLADGNMRPPMELPKRLEEEVEEENIPPAPGRCIINNTASKYL